MKIKFFKYIVYLICGACAVIFFIMYYTNSKYNVIPRKYVRQYLDETYNMRYEIIEENFNCKNGFYRWEFICQDNKGYIFRMEYCRSTEDEGPVTPEDASMVYVYDGFIKLKLKEEFQDRIQWTQGGNTKEHEHLLFEIYDESDIGQSADIIVDVFEFAFGYLQHVYEDNLPVVCSVYCRDLYKGSICIDSDTYGYKDKTREELYELVYSKLEEKFEN